MTVKTVTVWRTTGDGRQCKSHEIIGSKVRTSVGQEGTSEKPQGHRSSGKTLADFLIRDPEPTASSVRRAGFRSRGSSLCLHQHSL